jgi:hypothetical protein
MSGRVYGGASLKGYVGGKIGVYTRSWEVQKTLNTIYTRIDQPGFNHIKQIYSFHTVI